jgi:putative aminopeptidase FrvX
MNSSSWNGFEKYKKLASAYGPPGLEGAVRDELTSLLRPYTGRLETDRIGNLYAEVGSSESPVVMIGAHMDEVALVVTGITSEGLLKVKPQGYLQPKQFDQQPLVILTSHGLVNGFSKIKQGDQIPTIADVRIDVGASSAGNIENLGIQLGDRVCFLARIEQLDSGMVSGKSADDRTGVFALAEIARRLIGKSLPIRIVLTGTVQEEAIDTYAAWAGAGVAARRIDPLLMLGIDTIGISELDEEDEIGVTLEGRIGILRGAQDLHHGLVDHILNVARSRGIMHQIIPLPSTAADYTSVMRTGAGVPCAGLAIPISNPHSSKEIFLWKTLEDAVNLIIELLEEPHELLRISNDVP